MKFSNAKWIYSCSLIFIGCAAAWADDGKPFEVNANVTFASKYMADGFKIGGDHPVWQPSVGISTPLQGVSAAVWSSLQIDQDNQQYDELDLMALYQHDFVADSRYAFNLHGYYDYWTYPKMNIATQDLNDPTENMHGNKLHAGISMIHLLPLLGSYLVPSYNVYYWLYWEKNQIDQYQGGAHHELLLSYYHSIPKYLPGSLEQYVGLSGSANYNDGAFGVAPGWSHSVAQLSTSVYAQGWIFAFSVNQQWSYMTSVDPTNELWSMLSFTKQF